MGRQAAVGVIAARVGRIDDSVDEIEIVLLIYQHVAVYRIKYVMLTVGVVFSVVLRVET